MKTRLCPTRSPSEANGSRVATIANWYAFTIQTDADGVVFRSSAICGRAVLAIAVSRLASETASRIAVMASPRPVAGGSCVCAAAGALAAAVSAIGGRDDMTDQPSARI